jgi:hypothetical protein
MGFASTVLNNCLKINDSEKLKRGNSVNSFVVSRLVLNEKAILTDLVLAVFNDGDHHAKHIDYSVSSNGRSGWC